MMRVDPGLDLAVVHMIQNILYKNPSGSITFAPEYMRSFSDLLYHLNREGSRQHVQIQIIRFGFVESHLIPALLNATSVSSQSILVKIFLVLSSGDESQVEELRKFKAAFAESKWIWLVLTKLAHEASCRDPVLFLAKNLLAIDAPDTNVTLVERLYESSFLEKVLLLGTEAMSIKDIQIVLFQISFYVFNVMGLSRTGGRYTLTFAAVQAEKRITDQKNGPMPRGTFPKIKYPIPSHIQKTKVGQTRQGRRALTPFIADDPKSTTLVSVSTRNIIMEFVEALFEKVRRQSFVCDHSFHFLSTFLPRTALRVLTGFFKTLFFLAQCKGLLQCLNKALFACDVLSPENKVIHVVKHLQQF